jgi:hypothetical protein
MFSYFLTLRQFQIGHEARPNHKNPAMNDSDQHPATLRRHFHSVCGSSLHRIARRPQLYCKTRSRLPNNKMSKDREILTGQSRKTGAA